MRTGNAALVVVLIVLLLAAGVVRDRVGRPVVASAATTAPAQGQSGSSRTQFSVDQLDSYSMGLLLGGLRGPLVMVLWSTSETQKNERDLDDFDTKLAMIRMLQPEFDTVHLFQMWNKAYNISVQMANLPSKYSVILGGIKYGKDVRAERKNNVNIESEVARIFFDKLGNASEKQYFRQRIRDDSLPPTEMVKFLLPIDRAEAFAQLVTAAGIDPRVATLRRELDPKLVSAVLRPADAEAMKSVLNDPAITTSVIPIQPDVDRDGTTPLRYDTLLDSNFQILPQLANRVLSPSLPADTDYMPEAGELQYLIRFEPFPDGVSTFALSYNYYKRSVALMTHTGQKHAQLSERVISSRPALALNNWTEEEYDRGRRAEMTAFGKSIGIDTTQTEIEEALANLEIGSPRKSRLIDSAIRSYERGAKTAVAAIAEYQIHLRSNREDISTYASHISWMRVLSVLLEADKKFLIAMSTDGESRIRAATEAYWLYQEASDLSLRNGLMFYANDDMVSRFFPKNASKFELLNLNTGEAGLLSSDEIGRTFAACYSYGATPEAQFSGMEDFEKFRAISGRSMVRASTLNKLIQGSE
jgi:hypothetical protein